MNSIKFLGTAGARFVMMKQVRASGGIWLSIDDTTLLIDPGPGSLVRCLSSKPKLDPQQLDGIILTHRHIDHSNDVNIMIEAMTNGGYTKKGHLLAPKDCFEQDPVVLQYIRSNLTQITPFKEQGEYTIKNLRISTPVKHIHGVETYGLNIKTKDTEISLISDTEYFSGLETFYPGKILIINVVLFERKDGIFHLCLEDAQTIIKKNKPKLTVLTHFGMNMIRAKPWDLAQQLTEIVGTQVIAARDGMELNLDKIREDSA